MDLKIRISPVISTLKVSAILIIALFYLGCDNDVDIPDGAFDERIVDLNGSWTVSSVLQNGVDITDRMEFSRIDLQLNSNAEGPSSFTIENDGLPFLVTRDGEWSYDDNIYPTQMIFTAAGESRTAAFATPPISGGDDFTISFALGCADNTYTYLLTRQ
jgi:hypothetical protein